MKGNSLSAGEDARVPENLSAGEDARVPDNKKELNDAIEFFKRHIKLLTIVFVVAVVVFVIVSCLITPRYKSTVILFPTNSNRLSKAILAERYSMDYMDYGSERDCEYAIQILTSKSMEDAVCEHFNLMEHYKIKPDDPQKRFNLHEKYISNVDVRRTEFMGVEISVLDIDPQKAADMANYIAAHYDTLCCRIHHDRAADAYIIMDGLCTAMEADVRSLSDTLKVHPGRTDIAELLNYKVEELSSLQTRMTQTKVDLGLQVRYKFWIDQAEPADKKAYPKRALVVLLGTFGTLAVAIMMLLLVDVKKRRSEI